MDYLKHYNLLMSSRKETKTVSKVYEIHHILPTALGGTDERHNLVELTPSEHFIAHLLLAKIHGGVMWFAFNLMKRIDNNNKKYERYRKYYIMEQSKNKLSIWAKKKGFESYDEQCEYYWNEFINGKTLAEMPGCATVAIRHYVSLHKKEDEFKKVIKERRAITSKNIRLNESKESKNKRTEACRRNGYTGRPQGVGEDNTAAVKVEINGVIYGSIKTASDELNLKYHEVRKRIKSDLYPSWLIIKKGK